MKHLSSCTDYAIGYGPPASQESVLLTHHLPFQGVCLVPQNLVPQGDRAKLTNYHLVTLLNCSLWTR